MARKLLMNGAAEKEANDIAFKFMNSSDVLSDMKSTFGSRLSGVRLHDDESAAERASSMGRDAVASGNDIYFKPGILGSHTPESNGLIAHELVHTMQQSGSGAPGISENVSYGESQGGLGEWFKSLFGKKRKDVKDEADDSIANEIDDMIISEPTLVSGYGTGKVDKVVGDRGEVRSYRDSSSAALGEIVRTMPKEMAQNPLLIKLVQDDFNKNMSARLQASNDISIANQVFRGGTGEVGTMSDMMRALLPEDYTDTLSETMDKEGMEGVLSDVQSKVTNPGALQDLMAGTYGAFEGNQFYTTDEQKSQMMMNTLMLRGVGKGFAEKGSSFPDNDPRRMDYVRKQTTLMKGVNDMALGKKEDKKGFLGTLTRLFKR